MRGEWLDPATKDRLLLQVQQLRENYPTLDRLHRLGINHKDFRLQLRSALVAVEWATGFLCGNSEIPVCDSELSRWLAWIDFAY